MKRKAIIISSVGLITVLLLLLALPFLINLSKYKSEISQKASKSIGRQVEITGDISLSIFPTPHLTIQNIQIANIPGGSEKYLARLGKASVWVEFLPLLHKQVNLRSLSLADLDVRLEKLATGQNNWTFQTKNSTEPNSFEIHLSELSLEDSKLSYQAAGKKTQVKEINLKIQLEKLAGPYKIQGTLEAMGEPIGLTLNLQRPTPNSISITESSLEFRKKKISINANMDWLGALRASASLTGLPGETKANFTATQAGTSWTGNLALDSAKFLAKPLHVESNFAYAQQLALKNLLLTFEDIRLLGNLNWNPSSNTHQVSIETLQVSGLMPQPITLSGKVSADLTGTKPRLTGSILTTPITLPLSNSTEIWSKNPIDLSMLEKYEGQFDINIPRLTRKSISLDNLRIHVTLQNNTLSILPLTAGIYGGDLDMRSTISSKGAIILKTTLNNVQLNEVAGSESKLKLVSGTLALSSDLKTSGLSQYQWVSHLDGPVSIRTKNGRINGFDLDALIDQLSHLAGPEAFLGLFQTLMLNGSTAFNTYNGDILFNQGIGKIQSMTLVTHRALGTATGNINLPAYTLDVQAKLQITNPTGLPSFGAHVHGPIDDPKRDFDTESLKSYVLKNITRNIVPNLLNRLLGN